MTTFIHPNRVYVNELPATVKTNELRKAFAAYNVTIRTVRILETGGYTNYGFVTFNSKEEAERIIRIGHSQEGIVVAGARVSVQQAFSRHRPPRRNSGQLSAALQHLANDIANSPISLPDAHHQSYGAQAYHDSYLPPEFAARNSAQYVHYIQPPYWNPEEPFYVTPTSQTPLSAVDPFGQLGYSPQFAPSPSQGEAHSPHWLMPNGQVYSMDPSQTGLTQQYMMAPGPIEAMEAPTNNRWPPNVETTSFQLSPPESDSQLEPLLNLPSIHLQRQQQQQQQRMQEPRLRPRRTVRMGTRCSTNTLTRSSGTMEQGSRHFQQNYPTGSSESQY